jgi:hypothetical protein
VANQPLLEWKAGSVVRNNVSCLDKKTEQVPSMFDLASDIDTETDFGFKSRAANRSNFVFLNCTVFLHFYLLIIVVWVLFLAFVLSEGVLAVVKIHVLCTLFLWAGLEFRFTICLHAEAKSPSIFL